MDLEETFQMDFIGAAQSEGEPAIIYISCDEDDRMDCVSSGSMSDLASSLDEETEEIRVMARCNRPDTNSFCRGFRHAKEGLGTKAKKTTVSYFQPEVF